MEIILLKKLESGIHNSLEYINVSEKQVASR